MGRYAVIITGASGSVYGLRLVERLLSTRNEVELIVTSAGRGLLAYELELDLPAEETARALLRYLELPLDAPLRIACPDDLFDPLVSGSYPVDATVVIPASMGFCASVAAGLASGLSERTAEVALKEGRRLILVPRETPLSLVHLRNLTSLAEAGAVIVPAMPAFHHHPQTLDDQVNYVVGKVLEVLGIAHDLYARWGA
ncbi:MAG: UbiX family flavin prenyltransferase [Coriobacteriia bacterium]|jgi:4-hydroxy-3-polyprenylbenzoate decarboxylase|nr:UbiX family flavin prenyltransferase [Coriobacteriia bacterium]